MDFEENAAAEAPAMENANAAPETAAESATATADEIKAVPMDTPAENEDGGFEEYIILKQIINDDGTEDMVEIEDDDEFDRIAAKTEKNPLEVFETAMNNIMPVLEVKARRVGGATYQVPMEVRPERRQTMGLRWLTNFSRARNERTMEERLANEIMDAANNTGASVKRREDTHKMAEANKAFAHFRF